MNPVRIRTLAVGSALAVAAGLLVSKGAVLGEDLPRAATLGLAAGAVLGLVPGRSAAGKLGGLLAGFAAFLVGLQLLKSALPDTSAGRAVAAVVVVTLVTLVATATRDRLPLWAGMLGVATLTGTFQTLLAAGPGGATGDSATVSASVTTSLTAVAVGFLLSDVLPGLLPTHAAAPSDDQLDDQPESSLNELLGVPGPRSASVSETSATTSATTSADMTTADTTEKAAR